MTRIEIINKIIAKYNVKNYLEIGVNRGKCLFNIKGAEKRYAVDPVFNFSVIKKLRFIIKNPDNLKNVFFKMTSDDFFTNEANILNQNLIDLAFIDGLHTYKQSLLDTIHTLKHLSPNGIIILHDCNPLDEIAACPAQNIDEARKKYASDPNWKNIWNGDVWKTMVYLRKHRPDLSTFVLNTDHGLGFVLNKPSKEKLPDIFESIINIEDLEYSFLEKNREELLNLIPVLEFDLYV